MLTCVSSAVLSNKQRLLCTSSMFALVPASAAETINKFFRLAGKSSL